MILEKEGKKKKESKKSRARQGGTADMCPRLAREKHRSSAGMLCSSKHRAKWARQKVFPLGKSHHANTVVVRRGCTASQLSVSLLVNKAVSATACVILSSFFFFGLAVSSHLSGRGRKKPSASFFSFSGRPFWRISRVRGWLVVLCYLVDWARSDYGTLLLFVTASLISPSHGTFSFFFFLLNKIPFSSMC